MDPMKQVYLLLICQGFYLGSVGQWWSFPDEVTALIGSCVEIPCRHLSRTLTHNFSPVWYSYNRSSFQEILNTKDSSLVLEEYRDRTSPVPGPGSCTLRIDPVRREDGKYRYFPGNADKSIDPYVKASQGVKLFFRDTVKVQLHGSGTMTEGEATTIQCTAEHTCGSTPPTIQWNKPGRVTNQSFEISRGFWREESNFTYDPSYLDDGSSVQCTVIYPNGQKTERSIKATINYPPKNVTIAIFGMDEVMEGSSVSLKCNSFSKRNVFMEYEWYKGKEKSKLPERGEYISVWKLTWDMEPYSCAAINKVGRGESALIKIPVLYEPKNVTVTIIGKDEAMEGSDVTLQCNSFSDPDVSEYEWYKGEEKSKLPYTGREITVRNVTWNMEPYSCTAINRLGRGESALTEIPVLYAPKNVTVTVIGKDEVMEGSDVTLQCNSFSNPDVYEYEWYKGEDKSRLPERGWEIRVRNVTWNMEPYSCIAINDVGRGESALTEIPVIYRGFSITYIILSATIGTICLLLLALLVYCFWRKRCQTSSETEIPPDATYANLVKKEIENS